MFVVVYTDPKHLEEKTRFDLTQGTLESLKLRALRIFGGQFGLHFNLDTRWELHSCCHQDFPSESVNVDQINVPTGECLDTLSQPAEDETHGLLVC